MWNAMNVARACRVGLAGITLVLLSGSLAEAQYGPRTTIGALDSAMQEGKADVNQLLRRAAPGATAQRYDLWNAVAH